MPTRCNRGFYCRSYCLLNMLRAPLCPTSGAQEYYTVAAACGISCCGFQVAGLVWSWGLCVRFAGCCSILQTGHITRCPKYFEQAVFFETLSRKFKFHLNLTKITGTLREGPPTFMIAFHWIFLRLKIFSHKRCTENQNTHLRCGNKSQLDATEVFIADLIACSTCFGHRDMRPVCRMLQHPANWTHNPQLHTRPTTWKPQHEIPQAATTV